MPQIDELDLPELDILSPEFLRDPRSHYSEAGTHLAYGAGPHICLGRILATAMIEEALPLIVKHFPRPRIVVELDYIGPFGAWSVSALPIERDIG